MNYYSLISSMSKTVPSTLSNSLVSVYKAESNANDSLGTYNGTAVGGVTYTTGKSGSAFTLNGTTGYINIGDVMDLGTSSWSYSMWFNVASTATCILFSKFKNATNFGRIWAYTNANKITLAVEFSGTYTVIVETVNSISINTWYNVVFVVDRTDKLKIYLNGTLMTLTAILNVNNLLPYILDNLNNNLPFRIGAGADSSGANPDYFFNGKIDEFNIWNRVLTPSTITELYNTGTGKFYPY